MSSQHEGYRAKMQVTTCVEDPIYGPCMFSGSVPITCETPICDMSEAPRQLFSTEPLVARSCRMDDTTCYCHYPQCPMYGQIAPRAQVKMHDWHRQGPRFRCARCGGIVSATTGTAYAGIRTDLTAYLRGAVALAEGRRHPRHGTAIGRRQRYRESLAASAWGGTVRASCTISSATCISASVSWTSCGHLLRRRKTI